MKGYTCFSVEKRVWISPKNQKIIILFRQTTKCHTEGKLVFWSARGRLYRWNEMPLSEATVHPHISLKIFLSLSLMGSWDLLNWKITTLVAPSVFTCNFLNWKSVGVDLVLTKSEHYYLPVKKIILKGVHLMKVWVCLQAKCGNKLMKQANLRRSHSNILNHSGVKMCLFSFFFFSSPVESWPDNGSMLVDRRQLPLSIKLRVFGSQVKSSGFHNAITKPSLSRAPLRWYTGHIMEECALLFSGKQRRRTGG